jgi:hypothetical protein
MSAAAPGRGPCAGAPARPAGRSLVGLLVLEPADRGAHGGHVRHPGRRRPAHRAIVSSINRSAGVRVSLIRSSLWAGSGMMLMGRLQGRSRARPVLVAPRFRDRCIRSVGTCWAHRSGMRRDLSRRAATPFGLVSGQIHGSAQVRALRGSVQPQMTGAAARQAGQRRVEIGRPDQAARPGPPSRPGRLPRP